MFEVAGVKGNKAVVYADYVEEQAIEQIKAVLDHPSFINEKIAIMPDCHAGKGCVIGFSGSYSNSIIPSLVGVDIGCGMLAVNVGKEAIDLKALDEAASQVPWGFGKNEKAVEVDFDYGKLVCKLEEHWLQNAKLSIGSVGGGNHFMECNVGNDGSHWIVVHSGSRGFGVSVASYWQDVAKKMHPEMKADLASLEGEAMQGYINDVDFAAKWAVLNRKAIMDKVLGLMGLKAVDSFECIHNYVDVEHCIVRKGSIAAYKGSKVLIPLNMKDGSLICIGKGNEDWNCSAPHGAGRKMSRSQAKKLISMEDFKESMKGIYSSSVCEGTLDEAPFAYKDSNSIVNLIDGNTVDIIDHIHPIWNMKAH